MPADHDRVVASGAWAGAIAVSALLAWADTKIPLLCGWLVNTAVVLSVCWLMAAWKRAWYAWLAFWGMVAICTADGCLDLAGAERGGLASGVVWLVAVIYVTCWYWLVRAPRQAPPEPPQPVQHVIHHHVLDPDQALPTARPVPVPTPAVPARLRPALSRVRLALPALLGQPERHEEDR
jgi:hypothetical protein